MAKDQHRIHKKKFKTSLLLVLVVLVIVGFPVWKHYQNIHEQKLRVQVRQVDVSDSNLHKSTATYSSQPKSQNGTGLTQSASTDTNGKSSASTNESQWVTSASGNVTLEQPIADSTISSGAVMSGTAKNTSTVNYRLNDDSVGVLTEGTLNVVNGKFSGLLSFKPQSTTGRLDVFTTNSQGVEFDEIQIGVKF